MRTLLAFLLTAGGVSLVVFLCVWIPDRLERKYKDRSQRIKDETYLELQQAINLWERVLEYDDNIPTLFAKHKIEAREIVDRFKRKRLNK